MSLLLDQDTIRVRNPLGGPDVFQRADPPWGVAGPYEDEPYRQWAIVGFGLLCALLGVLGGYWLRSRER